MPDRQEVAAAAFHRLHSRPGGFILPNAWDAGSAIVLAEAGFEAIATTSAGIAFSLGKQDFHVTDQRLAVSADEMFACMAQIVAAVNVPVNGDLEAGYGDTPADVAHTIGRAIGIGLAGGNIEDKMPGADALYAEAAAVERIAAARVEIDRCGHGFVLTARTDALQLDPDGIAACIRRGNAYLAAGAHCVFVPGAANLETVAILAREIHGPLNIVLGLTAGMFNARDILAAGACRVSLGGTIARATLGFVRRAASELMTQGTIGFADGQMSGAALNALMSARAGDRS